MLRTTLAGLKRGAATIGRLVAPLLALGDRSPRSVLIGAFVLSRGLAAAAGVRFDLRPLETFFQYLDRALLSGDLLASVWRLHAQPPLYNLFLGAVLHVAPADPLPVFAAVHLGWGIVLALGLHELARRLGLPRRVALWGSVLFVTGPACLLYENWLFYTYPLVVLLVLAAIAVHRFATGEDRHGVPLALLLATIVLTRSLFHPLWMLLALGVAGLAARPRRLLVGALVPVLAVAGWFVASALRFGTPAGSTWLGMNLARATTFELPRQERRALITAGVLSPLADIPPFSELDRYRGLIALPAPTGHPALDAPTKSTGGTNFNHLAYVAISRAYLRDAGTVLTSWPGVYAAGVAEGWYRFLAPATDYHVLIENRRRIGLWDDLTNLFLLGRLRDYTAYPTLARIDPAGHYWSAALSIPWLQTGAFAFGLIVALRRLGVTIRRGSVDRAADATIAFLVLTVLFVTAVGNGLEVGENNRFRVAVDSYFWLLFGLAFFRRRNGEDRP